MDIPEKYKKFKHTNIIKNSKNLLQRMRWTYPRRLILIARSSHWALSQKRSVNIDNDILPWHHINKLSFCLVSFFLLLFVFKSFCLFCVCKKSKYFATFNYLKKKQNINALHRLRRLMMPTRTSLRRWVSGNN